MREIFSNIENIFKSFINESNIFIEKMKKHTKQDTYPICCEYGEEVPREGFICADCAWSYRNL